ncbi:leucine-rich repeat-containing protein 42 [Chanos chanos]|uniref:Leucine-rich repeat-containing protein 42 n=1 Tax=Chanos chanos TaxID=29144 RepID=A0A6J2VGZ5_CHACN|nr:leucine-rich repeat-containing protein 42 [Chanos chanos]
MYSSEVYECGPVYVREKGELRCVKTVNCDGARQYAGCKPHRLFERDFSVRLCIDSTSQATSAKNDDHIVFTYNKEGSLRYTAKSLFDICLLFIAENVQHVDSLVGFPEQMADRLFATAEEKQKFSDPLIAPKALQVFSEAYGELVLKSLCLRDRGPLVCERLDEIKTFRGLRCLDLFGCRLGDQHDIFKHITSEALNSLVQLSLGGNCLSDRGLQTLTAPVRVMKRGLENLQLLDLSYNQITEKGIGYLTCLPKLKGLDISETNVKLDAGLKELLWNKMGMILSEPPVETFSHSSCKTEGWAEQVINQWEMKAAELPKKEPKPRTNALHFYGRTKFVREALNSTPTKCGQRVGKTLWIQFLKPEPSLKRKPSEHSSGIEGTLATQKKRKRFSTNQEQIQ